MRDRALDCRAIGSASSKSVALVILVLLIGCAAFC